MAEKATIKLQAMVADAVRSLEQAEQEIKRLGGAGEVASRKTRGLGDSLSGVSRKAQVAFAALAAGAGVSVNEFAKFEKATVNVQNITEMSTGSLAELQQQILALPPALGSATDLTNALYQAISSGVDPAHALDFVVQTAKAAKGNLADLTQTVDGATSILNAYGMSASQVGDVLDAMTKTVDLGKLTFSDLADNVGKGISIAAQAGVTYQELLATMATLTKNGLSVEEAMTAIRNILTVTIKPTAQVQKAMKGAGVEMGVAQLKSQGLAKYMGTLAEAIGGNTQLTAQLFPNIRALNGAMQLASDKGAAQLADALDQVRNSAGKVERNFGRMSESTASQLEQIKVSAQKVAIVFGHDFAESLRPAFESILGLTEAMRRLPDSSRMAFSSVGRDLAGLALGVAVLPRLASGLGKVGSAAGKTWRAASELPGTLNAIRTSGFAAAGGIKSLGTSVLGLTGVVMAAVEAGRLLSGWFDSMNQLTPEYKTHLEEGVRELRVFGQVLKDQGFDLEKVRKAFGTYTHALEVAKNSGGRLGAAWAETSRRMADGAKAHADAEAKRQRKLKAVRAEINDLLGSVKEYVAQQKEATESVDDASEAFRKKLGPSMADINAELEKQNDLADTMLDQLDLMGTAATSTSDDTDVLDGSLQAITNATDLWLVKSSDGIATTLKWSGAIKEFEQSILNAYGVIQTSLGDVVYDSITGQFDDLNRAWDHLWKGLASTVADTIGDALMTALAKDEGSFKDKIEKLFVTTDKSGKLQLTPLGKLTGGLAGAAMAYGGFQQGGLQGGLTTATGTFMALAPIVSPLVAGIAAGVTGLISGLFGGSKKPPNPQLNLGWTYGGGVSLTGEHFPAGFSPTGFEHSVQAVIQKTQDRILGILEIFNDPNLFGLADLKNLKINWTGHPAVDDLKRVVNDILTDWLPGQIRNATSGAFYAGLGSKDILGKFKMSGEQVTALYGQLQQYDMDTQLQMLQQFVAGLVGLARATQGVDWTNIDKLASETKWQGFNRGMQDMVDEIDLVTARMQAELDIAARGQDAVRVAQLVDQARQAEIQMLQQIKGLQEQITSSFEAASEDIKLAMMSPQEQVDYLRQRIQDTMGALGSATDPQQVQELTQQLLSLISRLRSAASSAGVDLTDVTSWTGGAKLGDWLQQLLAQAEDLSNTALQGAVDQLRGWADALKSGASDAASKIPGHRGGRRRRGPGDDPRGQCVD